MDFKKWGKDELQDSPKQSEQPLSTDSQPTVTSTSAIQTANTIANDLQAFYSTQNVSGSGSSAAATNHPGPYYYNPTPIPNTVITGNTGTWSGAYTQPLPDAAILARIDTLEGKITEIHEIVEHLKDAISIFTKLVNFE